MTANVTQLKEEFAKSNDLITGINASIFDIQMKEQRELDLIKSTWYNRFNDRLNKIQKALGLTTGIEIYE